MGAFRILLDEKLDKNIYINKKESSKLVPKVIYIIQSQKLMVYFRETLNVVSLTANMCIYGYFN